MGPGKLSDLILSMIRKWVAGRPMNTVGIVASYVNFITYPLQFFVLQFLFAGLCPYSGIMIYSHRDVSYHCNDGLFYFPKPTRIGPVDLIIYSTTPAFRFIVRVSHEKSVTNNYHKDMGSTKNTIGGIYWNCIMFYPITLKHLLFQKALALKP